MKDGRSGSRSATPWRVLPDRGPDDRAGRQSSGAIHDDIDRRVPAPAHWTGASVGPRDPATQIASAWLQGQRNAGKSRTVAMQHLHEEILTTDRVGLIERFDVRCRHLDLHWTVAVRRMLLGRDPPDRRLRAVAPRRAEDRRREDLTDVFRLAWEHGVNGQAQVIKGMQQIIHSYTLLGDKEAMSETVANVRWLIAAGIRDFQAMLEELGKLQKDLPRDAPAPDEPLHDD
jgi:hypothetical protein